MLKNKKSIFFISLFLFWFLGTSFTFALEINYPPVPGAVPPQDFINTAPPEEIVSLYAKYIFHLIIWIAGIIALGGFIAGGIRYLLSTGKPEAIIAAKEQVFAAFLGLLILFSSFLVLQTINPQIIIWRISPLKPAEITKVPEIKPPTEKVNSSIDAEMPFGRIIEKIFETYISEVPKPKEQKTPRMDRIKDIALNSLTIAEMLRNQSEDLKKLTDQCTCGEPKESRPCTCCICDGKDGQKTCTCCKYSNDQNCSNNEKCYSRPCCEDDDPGPGCSDNKCGSKEGCTCDPCSLGFFDEKKSKWVCVRQEIKNLQQKNLDAIFLGIEIQQKQGDGSIIKTSLIMEQKKAEEEIRLLKEEIGKLERAEKFIEECPLRSLISFAQFLLKKNTFKTQNWTLREIKFWDAINIAYKQFRTGKIIYDYASFKCSVSGTLEQEYPFQTLEPDEESLTGEETQEAAEVLSEKVSCSSNEAPVGEIIDRAKKTGYKLVERLETLVNLSEQMDNAVDQLHVFISQCSSQRCYSECHGTKAVCMKECKNSDSYPEGPCPKTEIAQQLQKIIEILEGIPQEQPKNKAKQKEGIRDVVNGPKKENPNNDPTIREKIGIITIINQVVPGILGDLETIRYSMKHCVSKDWLTQDTILLNCLQTKGGVNPKGEVIRFCCDTESLQNGEKIITSFGSCFAECYLEIGQESHRKCVGECLKRKGEELNDKDLPYCLHRLNFYCCSVKK